MRASEILPIKMELMNRQKVHPMPNFSQGIPITPKFYFQTEKQNSNIKRESIKNIHQMCIMYDIEDKKYILDIQLNTDLIPKDYFATYQRDGQHVIQRPNIKDVDMCHYKGVVRNAPNSWVALSVCEEGRFSGVVHDGHDVHYIENYNGKHLLYKQSVTYNPQHNTTLQHKREAQLRWPFSSQRSRYVELVLVVDHSVYKEKGSITNVEQYCKQLTNIVNGLYTSLNIVIALVGIVVWTEKDEIALSSDGDITLTNFLHYRRKKLLKDHPNDNAQLLTKVVFDNGVLGKALNGPICTFEYSGGVNKVYSPVIARVATTLAHTMGHNFGMEHDTSECRCPETPCIMFPEVSNTIPLHWSSCSLDYLALAFHHGMDYCLRNKPVALYGGSDCGNGIVEPGEQCDCGLVDKCNNPCCNAGTCMLFNNATCATGECCDLQSCRPKLAGALCRSAEYECDLSEYCNGESEFCPADVYKMDTESCEEGKAYCYKGSCRTHLDQCKLLWGESGKPSDDQCFLMNTKGNRRGNCGSNRFNQTYFKCKDEDVMCGMLHCKHLNERLEFGMESVAILSHSYITVNGSVVQCRNAIIDLGLDVIDPGLTPDGAKCGDDKMCINQKCVSVASLRASRETCNDSCNGNGVCNNLGHCHCNEGFALPFCERLGLGGSDDNGPARNSHDIMLIYQQILNESNTMTMHNI